jgi:hypothetical protein
VDTGTGREDSIKMDLKDMMEIGFMWLRIGTGGGVLGAVIN